jgi:hypothetical protein
VQLVDEGKSSALHGALNKHRAGPLYEN